VDSNDETAATRDSTGGGHRAMLQPRALGETVAERYTLEAEIGRGGFGVVYRALDTRLNKRVAVKVLSASVADTPASLTRFKQEATAAARIGHKGIVDVTDAGEDADGTHFIVMEYIEGIDLRFLLRAEAPLPLPRALSIAARAAQALSAAHEQGIVHRDLKPGNILLTSVGPVSDFVKILDFGVSKIMSQGDGSENLTQDGQVVGTPRYMAPEQGLGDAVIDDRIDIYSLGTLLYEMVAGQVPFSGSSHYEIIHNKLSSDPLPPSLVDPSLDLPRAFEDLVLRALARDPEDRFQSMAAFELAIRELLEEVDPVAASGVRPAVPTPIPRAHGSAESSTESQPTQLAKHTSQQSRGGTPSAALLRARATAARKVKRRRRNLLLIVAGSAIFAAAGLVLGTLALRSSRDHGERTPAEQVEDLGPPAPSTPSEPQPNTVEVRFAVHPPNARVAIDGVLARENPVRLPRSNQTHEVVVSAPGHATARRTFQALVDGEVVVELEPAREGEPAPKRPPRKPGPHKPGPRLPDSPL